MVRDLARKTGKEIRLVMEGEEAEIDPRLARHVFASACFFVLGLATVFVALGISATTWLVFIFGLGMILPVFRAHHHKRVVQHRSARLRDRA